MRKSSEAVPFTAIENSANTHSVKTVIQIALPNAVIPPTHISESVLLIQGTGRGLMKQVSGVGARIFAPGLCVAARGLVSNREE